jgi:hypothetical protein
MYYSAIYLNEFQSHDLKQVIEIVWYRTLQ